MSEQTSFEQDVLSELGDDRLREIADVIGTDPAGAQDVVGTTVSTLSGSLRDKAETADPVEADEVRQAFAEEAPLQGVATLGGGLGGLLGGGVMAGMLSRLSRPVASAVAKKTGLPAATVVRVVELLIPVVLTVLTKRAQRAKPPGAASASPGAASPSPGGASAPPGAGGGPAGGGLGDLLGEILGGGGRK
ncbi:DUF937 domain-containing protein [Streptomyces aureocirculatus]|uniref:DUF937 domain-containing protein n=1 Tax=Streptomyces aureocirculatus TaxID=67275 RepID=UPI0004C5F8B8|nr:DUF937 domain-containing protein [Streptomyces aureocirculatus]